MQSVSQEQRDKSLFQAKLLAGALWEASAVLIDQLFEDIAGLRSLAQITRQDIAGSFVLVATVPAPQVSNLCPGLSDWKLKALQEAATPGSTTITIAADVSELPEFADWSFVSTVGKLFDAIINPQPGVVPSDGIIRVTCYGNSAGYLPGIEGDDARIQHWIDDFLDVAPALSGRIVGSTVATWEHCFAVLSPKRNVALPQLQRSVGNLHFAGDRLHIRNGRLTRRIPGSTPSGRKTAQRFSGAGRNAGI